MATTICATPSTSARVHLSPYPPPPPPPPPKKTIQLHLFYSSSLKELLTTAQKVGRNMIGLTRVMIQCLTRLGGCEAEGRGEGRGEERGEERGEGRGDVGRGR